MGQRNALSLGVTSKASASDGLQRRSHAGEGCLACRGTVMSAELLPALATHPRPLPAVSLFQLAHMFSLPPNLV